MKLILFFVLCFSSLASYGLEYLSPRRILKVGADPRAGLISFSVCLVENIKKCYLDNISASELLFRIQNKQTQLDYYLWNRDQLLSVKAEVESKLKRGLPAVFETPLGLLKIDSLAEVDDTFYLLITRGRGFLEDHKRAAPRVFEDALRKILEKKDSSYDVDDLELSRIFESFRIQLALRPLEIKTNDAAP